MKKQTSTHTSCPYCKSKANIKFRTKDRNRRISKEKFNYYSCSSCNLIFLSPTPTDLKKYYYEEYYQIPATLEELAKASGEERYKIDIIQQFVSKGRLLEIGPATGGFAYHAKQAGFEVEAIEMDSGCCRFLREVVKIPTLNTDDVIAGLQKTEPYNVIALWHVIEHLPDPWNTLNEIMKRLLPGGILVIAAPNPNSFQFRILRRFWAHVDAPRHLELIPHQLLSRHMENNGFKTLLFTTRDRGGIGWNQFGWAYSFANFSSQQFVRKALSILGIATAKSLYLIENRNGIGSTYTMVFQKEGAR